MSAEIIYLPTPELTPEQREHWQAELELAETAVETAQRRAEDCMRMLGHIGLELGLES